MKPITAEWVDKAEGDFATAQRELNALDHPNYDAVCFHSQQCAEKYLKAFLQEKDIPFRKTHDLAELLNSTLTIEPAWESLRPDLHSLSSFAVEYRYPGETADADEAGEALAQCHKVRQVIRQALGLEPRDISDQTSSRG
jgi:HEPN domain-containing protein